MLEASVDIKDQIKKSSTISMSAGLWAEYNMNDLISGVTIENLGGETVALKDAAGVEYKPFLKLFPLASVISAKRPSSAGIKYFIANASNSSGITYNVFYPYNTLIKDPYRMYYAGSKNKYQYWVTPKSNSTGVLTNCKLYLSLGKLNGDTCNLVPDQSGNNIGNVPQIFCQVPNNTCVSSSSVKTLLNQPHNFNAIQFYNPPISKVNKFEVKWYTDDGELVRILDHCFTIRIYYLQKRIDTTDFSIPIP